MTRKVRVLQLIDQLGEAGAEQLLYTFTTRMDRSRFEIHVIGLRQWPRPKIAPDLRAQGYSVVEMNQEHAYDLPILRSLVDYIRREKIDIIHTHLLAADVMGRMAGFLTRRPVVSTIHNGRVDLDQEPRHRQMMERWTARLWCRRLIVVSGLLHDEIADWFGVPRRRVVTIPNGIDTARYVPGPDFDAVALKRELLGGDYPMVVNVARHVPQKGHSYLLEAAARVLADRPDVRFLLVGDGPLESEILAQAQALGIADKLVITGFRTDVPQLLNAGDAFVLSSLWEGMPIALLEAMAAGCPAIATDVGGVGQLLKNGATGLLVPPADPAALAAAISATIDQPTAARQRAEAARQMVVQEFDISNMIRRCEALYLGILRRKLG